MHRHDPSLIRRLFPAVALTGVGFGLVNILDRPAPVGSTTGELLDAGGATLTSVAAGDTVPVTTAGTPDNVATQGQQTAPVTQTPASTVAPKAKKSPSTVAPASTAAPAPTAAPSANDCGAVERTGTSTEISWRRSYGVIQVTVKATSAGQVCGATAQYQTYDNKSARYEDYAVPVLNKQVAAASGANIQGVSGATAVSVAYQKSLQSAIDQL